MAVPESPTVSNSSCLIALDAAGSLGILERLYRTIALSIERSAARLILDDKKPRRVARQLNLPVTGTLAVLLNAKERGIIPKVRTPLMYFYPPTSGSLFGLIVRAEDGDSRSDNQQNDCPRLIGRLRQSRKRLPCPYVSDIPGHDFVHSAQSLFAQCAVIHGPLDPFSDGSRCRLGHAGRRSMSRFQRPADSLARDQGPCWGGPGLRARQQFSCFSDRVELLVCGVHGRVDRTPGPGSIKNGG